MPHAPEPPQAPDISIVYRALNEERWFEDSLLALAEQDLKGMSIEAVLVDSGSTDRTLEIAEKHGCRVTHIKKSDFSFGRSLNQGCDFARGKYLVFISAHCIPAHKDWLHNLIAPLRHWSETKVAYSYGKQIGHEVSKFSEKQLFEKYFPDLTQNPQDGFFINNANSAIVTEVWEKYRFDEDVTGLEDMVLGKAIVADGYKIAYIADAPVIHVHEEDFKQTKNRYYREALTLREIMPEVQMTFGDFIRYLIAGISHDISVALDNKEFSNQFWSILRFRYAQFRGSYKGHTENKKLSRAQKEAYYYPRTAK